MVRSPIHSRDGKFSKIVVLERSQPEFCGFCPLPIVKSRKLRYNGAVVTAYTPWTPTGARTFSFNRLSEKYKLRSETQERLVTSMNWYPLLLTPAIKDYLWGGTRLKAEFGFSCPGERAAEAWVLSSHPDGASTVTNGPEAGRTLTDVLEQWGPAALGERAAAFSYFPLLIKLIDARDRLSVQVHPDNAYALAHEGEYGKTEMWYVVDCEPGAKLIYGFNRGLTKEEFRRRIEDNTLEEVCNAVPVRKGDVFFIEAGTLHAIGAGILIAEVQQNSNTTYRVSDYGRLGADGKPRPLHVDKAMEVTKTTPPCKQYGRVGRVTPLSGGTVRPLASCEFFTADLLQVEDRMRVGCMDSFVSLLCLEGTGTLEAAGTALSLQKGSSVFLPAGMTALVTGSAQLLCSRV